MTLTFSMFIPDEAYAQQALVGSYDVQGSNPDGSRYRGTAVIKRVGDKYKITWKITWIEDINLIGIGKIYIIGCTIQAKSCNVLHTAIQCGFSIAQVSDKRPRAADFACGIGHTDDIGTSDGSSCI